MSTTLLRRIQDAATDPTSDLPSLLRLCMVLASRLRNEPLKAWVDAELNGYEQDQDLPEYRVFPAFSKMKIHNPMQGTTSIQIPKMVIKQVLGDELAEHLSCARVRQSIAEIAALSKVSEDGGLGIAWAHEMVMLVAPHITEWQGVGAKVELSAQKLIGILDVVRTRVLKFALELEEADPTLGEKPAPTSGPAADRVQQIVNQTFNFHGGSHTTVSAPVTQIASPEQRLRADLAEEGLSPDEVEQVTALVKQEKKPQGVLAKMKKLGGTLAKKATETGVAEVIKQFFGG